MIDPAESLLVITGIGMITGERTASISEEEINRARKLPETIEARTKSAFNGSLEHRTPAPIKFERALKKLSKRQTHEDHVERASKFPPGYAKLATSYNIILHQLHAEVGKMLPRQTWQSVTGTDVGPPSDRDAWRFLLVLQVIDEPLTVFRLIANGQLTKKQALAIKVVYPTFAQAVTTALIECAVTRKAANKKWRPGWILEKGLAAWFESTPIPPAMLRRLQESHVNVANQQPAPPAPASASGRASQSPAQRAQFGNVQ